MNKVLMTHYSRRLHELALEARTDEEKDSFIMSLRLLLEAIALIESTGNLASPRQSYRLTGTTRGRSSSQKGEL